MRKIYLDACALNRLTDDQSQLRIRNEAEAVQAIFHGIQQGQVFWVASVVLKSEIKRNPDRDKRQDALALLSFAQEILTVSPAIIERAETLEALGFGAFDALHLACAEDAHVDVLLTTDDRFLRQVARGLGKPRVAVANPIKWLKVALP
ncbi:putative nucleic acid-binding protein [Silvibacterium bohemicum]|uniref:Putative nucleic acid-binding protein n=1 Tax=Silvibacterium bohemicum TaxID=1577686 RepID=A0A841K3E2_9BACT|nr:PIN domain-containing protein [Silvibacterium bohemicum]MBB6147087.1 putative nucleic acid-binding protein [Silvibacterium bohemicum]